MMRFYYVHKIAGEFSSFGEVRSHECRGAEWFGWVIVELVRRIHSM